MRSRPIPESLLGLFAGRERAAAIYGDLIEMRATHGSVWFWRTYIGALAGYMRRPVAAFALGYVCYVIAGIAPRKPWAGPGAGSVLYLAMQHWIQPIWRLFPLSLERELFPLSEVLLAALTIPLWFALPYAAARYGPRDRFVQLTGGLAFSAILVSADPPALTPLFAVAAASVLIPALILPAWRGPLLVLLATLASGIAALSCAFSAVTLAEFYLQEQIHPGRFHHAFQLPSKTIALVALFVPAIVCSLIHRRLLEAPPLTISPGA